MSGSTRDRVLKTLPVKQDGMILRLCTRADYDTLAKWPPYQWPYDGFNLRFSKMSKEELDRLYEERLGELDRVTLVAEEEDTVVSYIALLEIDWLSGESGNMAVRLHPEYTDRGIGTVMLILVGDWWFRNGMNKLRLDVAATNHRAVRSYVKAGFKEAGEFWRAAPDLAGLDLSEQKYDFLRDNVSLEGDVPLVRFYWMEKTRK